MVTIKIHKSSFGYDSIYAENHSEDTAVCNSISAIMWGLAGTLMNLEAKPNINTMILNSGHFEIEIDPLVGLNQKLVDTCFFFAEVSLLQIQKKYPQYIDVIHI